MMTEGTINADVTMAGAAGVLLANRYRVVKQLGQGGMGSVWLAEDTKLDGRKVAVKMLPSILVSNKRAYAQVKAEALVSLKLTHPNIVAVRAFEEEGGNPFLVMDYIEGRTLDDYLTEKGTLTEKETIRLLGPIAAALDYAHEQGVVHRDVKPGNVMIDKSGHPYVLDFGIAREVQETMTRVTGKLSSGTLMYMSPEQLHGAAPKPAQDVYSFAVMAYECLTGRPPFSRGQIEYQIEHDAPEPLGPQFANCGQGVTAGLAKVPDARPATCAAVLSAAAKARSMSDGASASRTWIAAVLLGVLALGALVGGGWWWQDRVKSEELRVKNAALAAERARQTEEAGRKAEESRLALKKAEEESVAEEKRMTEKAKAVAVQPSEDTDQRRQEEVAKLTMTRTKITIKVAAAKDDYEKSSSYRTERDGFESHLSEIDRQWETVEGVQNPKSLAEAAKTLVAVTEAADAIAFELNWLKTNRDGRDAAKRIEQEIVGELDAKLHDFKANDVAKLKFDKGQGERQSAAAAFARGEFASARRQYETAKATLSAALAEARQFHIKTALAVANEYKAASQWQKCCDEVAKVLAWDAQNAEALELRTEAEQHMMSTVKRLVTSAERKAPKPGDTRTITLPGGAEMEMVWCPATTSEDWKVISGGKDYYMMGGSDSAKYRFVLNEPHPVRLTEGFWIGKYEVTQKQWSSVMSENKSRFRDENRPVDGILWQDCEQFVAKINRMGKYEVSLPTEAQWEYACKAGSRTTLPNELRLVSVGLNNAPVLDEIAWYVGNASVRFELDNGIDISVFKDKQYDGNRAGTHPVGTKKPNAWGIYDMLGNVSEWCSDWFERDYYASRKELQDPRGPSVGSQKIIKGGSFLGTPLFCCASYRHAMSHEKRNCSAGFRLILGETGDKMNHSKLELP